MSIQSVMVSQWFCVGPASKRWFLKTVQVTMKHGIHLAFTHSIGPSSIVWSELGLSPPFPPMRVLEVQWSRTLSYVYEVALSLRTLFCLIGVGHTIFESPTLLKAHLEGVSTRCQTRTPWATLSFQIIIIIITILFGGGSLVELDRTTQSRSLKFLILNNMHFIAHFQLGNKS